MKRFSSWLDFHSNAFINGLSIVKKNWLATGIVIFTISILLVLSSMFGMLSDVIRRVELDWHNNKQITLYLKVPSTKAEQSQLLARVSATDGVESANLRTAEDALSIMQDELGVRDILSYLPANPLPAVIEVTPSSVINDNDKLLALHNVLQEYKDVEFAKMDMDSIKRISLFLSVVADVFNIFILLIVVALLLVISNALRLMISDKIDEIAVLKFIGASDKFIRRPYLYIGALYGLLSAILAIIFINVLLVSMRAQVNDLLLAYGVSYEATGMSIFGCSLIILLSLLIGWSGAYCATIKYLRSS